MSFFFNTDHPSRSERWNKIAMKPNFFSSPLTHFSYASKSGLWYRFWNCRHQSPDPAQLATLSRTSGSPLLRVQEVLDNFSFILQNTSSNFLKAAQHHQYLQHWRNGQAYMNMCQSLVVLHSTYTKIRNTKVLKLFLWDVLNRSSAQRVGVK
jgi:hypothetical protein